MGIGSRLKSNWKHDRETLKALPFRQKLGFLADYYRWVILLMRFMFMIFYILGKM